VRERKNKAFRRSLFVVEDIKNGEELTERNVKIIRPACGMHPRYLRLVIGRKARKNISKGTPLKKEFIL